MFLWWEIDIPAEAVINTDTFFATLKKILTENLVHNTSSLPHALGEMAVSSRSNRTPDIERMLSMLLGEDWEIWLTQTTVANGFGISVAMETLRNGNVSDAR